MKRLPWGILFLVIILDCVGLVRPHPSGAGSCDSPKQGHPDGFKEGDGGYTLKVVPDGVISPNEKVNLVLSGRDGKKFKGFQIIAEEGSFNEKEFPDNAKLNIEDCEFDGRVTHTNNDEKKSISIPYKVSGKPGTVMVTYYVVEEFSIWYGPLTLEFEVLDPDTPGAPSESITEPEDIVAPKPAPSELEEADLAAEPSAENEGDVKPVGGGESEKKKQSVKEKILSIFGGKCTASLREGYDCMVKIKDFFTLHWKVGVEPTVEGGSRKLQQKVSEEGPMKGEVLFGMEGKTEGWVSIAFPEEKGEMDPADSVLGWVTGGEAVVKPYRITEKDVDADDVDENLGIRVVKASEEDGFTFIEFIKVADQGNVPFDIEKDVHLNYAIGKADRLEKHPSHGKGSITLNLKSGQSRRLKSDDEVYYMVHGSLMLIGWIVFLPLGISIARHRWSLPVLGESGWVDLHRFVQLFAIICIVIAVIIGLSTFEDIQSGRGKSHVTLAAMLLISLCIQGSLGAFRPKPDHPRRELFNKVHGWLGRVLAAWAVLTVLLGIAALKKKLQVDVTGWVASVILICLFHIILAFAAELSLQKRRKGGDSERIGEVNMTDFGSRIGYTRGLDEAI